MFEPCPPPAEYLSSILQSRRELAPFIVTNLCAELAQSRIAFKFVVPGFAGEILICVKAFVGCQIEQLLDCQICCARIIQPFLHLG